MKCFMHYLVLCALIVSCLNLSSCATKQQSGAAIGSLKVVKVNRELKMHTLRGEGFEVIRKKRRQDVWADALPYAERGEEIVVIWRYDGPAVKNASVSLNFDYQFPRENKIYRIEEQYTSLVPGRYVFKFRNTGDDYFNRGEIESWRVILLYDGVQVDQKRSKFFGKS